MARIKDSSIEEVKAAADMVAVVSARTQLRKTGGRYLGRCPFHEERTPSFSVNATDKLYYCFGCGAKGDLIGFVRETENLDFVGAIEWLADRFNMQIDYEETSPEQDARRRRRERLLDLLDAAASFYERYLWESQAGSLARDYLAGRGLGEDVCREHRLGLALGGSTLTRKALERGFNRGHVVLSRQREGRNPRRPPHHHHVAHRKGKEGGMRLRHISDAPCPFPPRPGRKRLHLQHYLASLDGQ